MPNVFDQFDVMDPLADEEVPNPFDAFDPVTQDVTQKEKSGISPGVFGVSPVTRPVTQRPSNPFDAFDAPTPTPAPRPVQPPPVAAPQVQDPDELRERIRLTEQAKKVQAAVAPPPAGVVGQQERPSNLAETLIKSTMTGVTPSGKAAELEAVVEEPQRLEAQRMEVRSRAAEHARLVKQAEAAGDTATAEANRTEVARLMEIETALRPRIHRGAPGTESPASLKEKTVGPIESYANIPFQELANVGGQVAGLVSPETGQAIQQQAALEYPIAPSVEQQTGAMLTRAVASTVPYAAASTMGLPAAAAAGAGLGVGQGRIEVLDSDASDAEKAAYIGVSGVLGAAEILPFFKAARLLPKAAGGRFFAGMAQRIGSTPTREVIYHAAGQSLEEAYQEMTSRGARNVAAKMLNIDPNANILDGLDQGGLAGLVVGAMFGGPSAAVESKARRKAFAGFTDNQINLRAEMLGFDGEGTRNTKEQFIADKEVELSKTYVEPRPSGTTAPPPPPPDLSAMTDADVVAEAKRLGVNTDLRSRADVVADIQAKRKEPTRASIYSKNATVYGPLRPQPVQGTQEVPEQEGGQGVQPRPDQPQLLREGEEERVLTPPGSAGTIPGDVAQAPQPVPQPLAAGAAPAGEAEPGVPAVPQGAVGGPNAPQGIRGSPATAQAAVDRYNANVRAKTGKAAFAATHVVPKSHTEDEKAITDYARRIGLNVALVDTPDDAPTGFYDSTSRTMVMSRKKAGVGLVHHEWLHDLAGNSPDDFAALFEYVRSVDPGQLGKSLSSYYRAAEASMPQLAADLRSDRGKRREEAMAAAIEDLSGAILNPQFTRAYLTPLAARNPTLFQKVTDAMYRAVGKVASVFGVKMDRVTHAQQIRGESDQARLMLASPTFKSVVAFRDALNQAAVGVAAVPQGSPSPETGQSPPTSPPLEAAATPALPTQPDETRTPVGAGPSYAELASVEEAKSGPESMPVVAPPTQTVAAVPSPTILPDEGTQRSFLEDRGRLTATTIRAMPMDNLIEFAGNIGVQTTGDKGKPLSKMAVAKAILARQDVLLPKAEVAPPPTAAAGSRAKMVRDMVGLLGTYSHLSALDQANTKLAAHEGVENLPRHFSMIPDELDGLKDIEKAAVRERVSITDDAYGVREFLGNTLFEAAKREAIGGRTGRMDQLAETITESPDQFDPADVLKAHAYLRAGVIPKGERPNTVPTDVGALPVGSKVQIIGDEFERVDEDGRKLLVDGTTIDVTDMQTVSVDKGTVVKAKEEEPPFALRRDPTQLSLAEGIEGRERITGGQMGMFAEPPAAPAKRAYDYADDDALLKTIAQREGEIARTERLVRLRGEDWGRRDPSGMGQSALNRIDKWRDEIDAMRSELERRGVIKPEAERFGVAANDLKAASAFTDTAPSAPFAYGVKRYLSGSPGIAKVEGMTKDEAVEAKRGYSAAKAGASKVQREFAETPQSAAEKMREGDRETGMLFAIKRGETEDDYRGEHSAPMSDSGSPLHDVTKNGTYPTDVYSFNGLRYYGTGEDKWDGLAYSLIRSYQNHPNRVVTVHRAVPKHVKGGIKPGDWVTPVRAYATNHGHSALGGDFKIQSKLIHARDIFTAGDSWLEWGYDPQPFDKVAELARRERIASRKADTAIGATKPPMFAIARAAGADPNSPKQLEAARKEWVEKGTGSRWFKRWFGDSKVVDENGGPLVVYHGTSSPPFSTFRSDKTRGGAEFFFTDKRRVAEEFGYRQVEVYLSLKNPYVVDLEGASGGGVFDAIDHAKANGFDGVIAKNVTEGEGLPTHQQIVAFHPSQIKSTANRGTFDPASPNMMFAVNRPAPTFYSALTRAVEGFPKPDAKMTPAQFKGWLAKQPVKAEEVKWTGLDELLERVEMGPRLAKERQASADKRLSDLASSASDLERDLSHTRPGFVERVRGINIPLDAAVEYASAIQDSPISADQLRNLGDFLATGDQPFSGLDINSRRIVVEAVRAAVHDAKIARSVVGLLPVDVVNDLGRIKQLPSNGLLHDPSVLKDVLAINLDSPIPGAIDKALEVAMRNDAFPATEMLVAATRMAGTSEVRHSALITDKANLGGSHSANVPDQFKSGKVTANEVAEYLRANEVVVEEVVKGGKPILADRVESVARGLAEANGDIWGNLPPSMQQRYMERAKSGETRETKFGSYTLPGGTAYRELLLTLPDRNSGDENAFVTMQRPQGKWEAVSLGKSHLFDTEAEAQAFAKSEREADGARGQNFNSSHWSEPNVLAHVRFDERTTADGKRTLHIAEVQSDWNAQAREKGVRQPVDASGWVVTPDERYEPHPDGNRRWIIEDASGGHVADITARSTEMAIDFIKRDREFKSGGVPDAPYIRSTEAYATLAMRRMVRWAASNGFDSLSWDTGAINAERYDLSKQVDHIKAESVAEADGVYFVDIRTSGGQDINLEVENGKVRQHDTLGGEANFFGKPLSEVIGKDMAEKIFAIPSGESKTFSGPDLRVGGHGMHTFYDSILPSVANKIGKKWGARTTPARVESIRRNEPVLEGGEEGEFDPEQLEELNKDYRRGESVSVHSLPITPEMRRSVVEEGQPMFALNRPAPLSTFTESDYNATPEGRELVNAGHFTQPDRFTGAKTAIGRLLRDLRGDKEDARQATLGADLPGAVRRRDEGTSEAVQRAYGRIAQAYPDVRAIDRPDILLGLIAGEQQTEDTQLRQAIADLRERIPLVTNPKSWGLTELAHGAESTVYLDSDESVVYKTIRTPAKLDAIRRKGDGSIDFDINVGGDAIGVFERVALGNTHGGVVFTEIAGVTEAGDIVLKQPLVVQANPSQWIDSERTLPNVGLTPVGKNIAIGDVNGQPVAFADLHGGNVLKDKRGNPYVIDPITRKLTDDEAAMFAIDRKTPLIPGLFTLPPAPPPIGPMLPGKFMQGDMYDDFSLNPETGWERFRRRVQDLLLPLQRAQRDIAAQGGKTARDPYKAEERRKGVTGYRHEVFEKRLVRPLIAAMNSGKLTQAEMDGYVMAKAAPDRNKRLSEKREEVGPWSGMSTEVAHKIVQAAESGRRWTLGDDTVEVTGDADATRAEAFGRSYKVYRRIVAHTQDAWVDAGLETQERVDELRKMEPFYAPFKTDFDEEGGFRGTGKGTSISGREYKKAAGRRSMADSPLAFTIQAGEKTIVRAEKNKVLAQMAGFVRDNPSKGLWSIQSSLEGLDKPDDAVPFKDDGANRYIVFKGNAKPLAHALKRLNADEAGGITQLIGRGTRFLAALSTRWNPAFTPFNAVRDWGTSAIHLAGEKGFAMAARVTAGIPKAWVELAKGDSDMVRRYKASGARITYLDLGGLDDTITKLDKSLKDLNPSKRRKAVLVARSLGRAIGKINDVVENASRFSAFKELVKSGVSDEQAGSYAKNLTTNFERKGEIGNTLNAWYMFANAGIQGSARVGHAVTHPGVRRIIAGGIATAVLMDIANRIMGGKDDDGEDYYDKVPEFEKQRSFIIMRPNGQYVSIPMPFVYRWFNYLGTKMGAAMHGDAKPLDIAAQLGEAAAAELNPLGEGSNILGSITPTPIDPFLQAGMNKDWKGSPIMPETFGRAKPRSERYWPSVNPTIQSVTTWLNKFTGGDKVVGGYVDVSPEMVEHFMGFMVGGAGKTYNQLATITQKMVKGEAPEKYEVPILGRLVHEQNPFAERRLLSDNLKESEKRANQWEAAVKSGESDRAASLRAEHGKVIALEKYLKATKKKIGQLEDQSDTLEGEEKKRVEESIQKLVKQANRRYNAAAGKIEEE